MNKTLVQDLAFSLIAPWAFYGVAAVWGMVTGAFGQTTRKIILSTTLGFVLFGLGLTTFSELDTLNAMWRELPYAFAGVSLVFGIVVPAGALYLIFRIWRPHRT
jgi:hypothetical protein